MNTTNNPVRKMITLIVTFAIGFAAMVTLACDENPCANGSACGITSPVTQVEQQIINAVDSNCSDNVLSGC